MPKIVAAALLGGPLTAVWLWGHGPVVALLCAPLGGSCAGLLAGLTIAAFNLRGTRGAPRDARAAAPSPVPPSSVSLVA